MATPTLFDTGIFSIVGLNSELLIGAKIYWYVATTSTPANTYTTAALSIANPNPVPFDDAGRLPQIWLDDGPYKYLVVPPGGGVGDAIVTVDNYTPAGGYLDAFITVLGSEDGPGAIGFSQSPAYGAGTLGLHAQNQLYYQDAPYGARGNGTTDDAAAIAASYAEAQDRHSATQGQPGTVNRINATISLTGNAASLVGDALAPTQLVFNVPGSVTHRGYGSGPVYSLTGTGHRFVGLSAENYGTHTDFLHITTGGAHHNIESFAAIGNTVGSVPFSRSVIYADAAGLGYSYLTKITGDDAAAPVFFLTKDSPNQSNPTVLDNCREFSVYTGPWNLFKYDAATFISLEISRVTSNQYAGEMIIVETVDNDDLVGFEDGSANKILQFHSSELGGSTASAGYRNFKLTNTGTFSFRYNTSNGGALEALTDLTNTRVYLEGNTFSSFTSIAALLDLESSVLMGPGNRFNGGNVSAIHNSGVTLAGCSFTAATTNGSYQITVTNVVGRLEIGLPVSGAGIPSGAVLRRQTAGTKGGAGTYQLYQKASATATGVACTQPAGTYQANSGTHIVPQHYDGTTRTFFIELFRMTSNGIKAFVIEYDTSLAGQNITIDISSTVPNPNIYPNSVRWKGADPRIIIRNSSGGAMGTITWGTGIKVSAAIAAPANGFTMVMDLTQHAAISGSTVTDIFIGGPVVSDIPN